MFSKTLLTLAVCAGPLLARYEVTLRLPADGLYSGEEMQIELRITDPTKEDPLMGATPVVRAKILSEIDMPAMRGMAVVREVAHPEGVPGDYGLHPTFAHGGEYRLRLTIEPVGEAAFVKEFKLEVGDERPKKAKGVSPFKLKVEKAGQGLEIRISDASGPVKDFDTVHERKLHFIVVTKDLKSFAHVHPELRPDGSFLLQEPLISGDLRLFADFAPKGKGGQVLTLPWKQGGKVAAPVETTLKAAALKPVKGAWVAGRTQEVLLEGGAPPSELEPYLGAMAHLVMIHEDAETFVHAHPIDDPAKIVFLARPPKVGKYRAWVETQAKGKVYTQSFDIEVTDAVR